MKLRNMSGSRRQNGSKLATNSVSALRVQFNVTVMKAGMINGNLLE